MQRLQFIIYKKKQISLKNCSLGGDLLKNKHKIIIIINRFLGSDLLKNKHKIKTIINRS